jgi:putative peptide zinc metalloprotease protein
MEKSYHSASWYRVANVRPRLRSHARIHRHHFRGQLWYILQDRTSGRFHRFSPEAYLIISLMTGERTVEQIWEIACARLQDDVLTQDEIIGLLGQLHSADVLYGDTPPFFEELSDRGRRQRQRKLIMSFMNPLALRIPLLDPDRFLNVTAALLRSLFSWFGLAVYIAVVAYGCVLWGQHWSELTTNIASRVLATESILLLVITYPVVKALHELGHAYAVKRFGGHVHEIGVMLLVFMPVPYVDASDSAAFQEKWQRAFVGAAGILVELLLAAIAMVLWVNSEEGTFRALMFSVMLIGGVSTVLFNGNPLLRFDGYYVLSDILEIPNLGSRANQYIGYLVKRYAFGLAGAQSPVTAEGERFWLFSYAIASFAYRLFITAAIVVLVANQFFVIGVLVAFWSLILMLGVPAFKQLRFLFTSPALVRNRKRALTVVGASLAACVAIVLAVPLPYSTLAEGIVWVRGDGVVHAAADGVVAEVATPPNTEIRPGKLLLQLDDPGAGARVQLLEARVAELDHRRAMLDITNQTEAKIAREELRQAQADLALARQRVSDLGVRSLADGQFVLPRATDLIGRFVRKGDVLGYVARFEEPVILAIVPEDSADVVRQRTRQLQVSFVGSPQAVHAARIAREVPTLAANLPNRALSTLGGGQINLDPTDPRKEKTIGNLLHLEIRLLGAFNADRIGERAHVRFFHGFEPLAGRIYRASRQVFLKHFKI